MWSRQRKKEIWSEQKMGKKGDSKIYSEKENVSEK